MIIKHLQVQKKGNKLKKICLKSLQLVISKTFAKMHRISSSKTNQNFIKNYCLSSVIKDYNSLQSDQQSIYEKNYQKNANQQNNANLSEYSFIFINFI